MCGISGYFNTQKPNMEKIKNMAVCLMHRGPDGEGYYIDDKIALGHRRLSIIDLKTGDQPIFNEDKSAVVIFNGEIYNFKELRNELQTKGHRFYTNSDTEVLVHLYEENGEMFPDKLSGIFAFALYDKKNQKLILARDPLGVKPLYYSIYKEGIIFGSELKSFLNFKEFSPTIDENSLSVYLQMEYYPAPLTPFKEIRKLLPGHIISFTKEKGCELKKYNFWNFEDLKKEKEEILIERIRQEIISAVKRQLVSDVPLGVFLSGGVDSSSVACAMKKAGADILSFSIGFEEKEFDESVYARTAAKWLNTSHYEKIFTEKDLINEVDFILSNLDEPLADPSIFPTALLSRFARERVKVALGGDGGDELFCGYPTYLIHKFYPLYSGMPKFLRRNLLNILDKMLPVSEGNLTFSYKARKFIDGAEKDMPERHFAFMGAFNREKLKKLIPDANLDFSPLDWIGSPPFSGRVTQAQWLDLHTYLMEDVLQKVDRMSMLSSLEVRVPLLDKEVVKLAFSIPSSEKIKGLKLKYLLKKAFEKDLPKGFFKRKKRGFAIPISKWIKGQLKDYVVDNLKSPKMLALNWNEKYIEQIIQDHFSNKQDNRKLIWAITVITRYLNK
ncbi:MAG: asparagine synthase (glutamine-hydrolyzing) [Acidobacteria bacterium]|nr:asparagine synthase (glutamine-hydrolyzing) [Acidobacteriota bacterium]